MSGFATTAGSQADTIHERHLHWIEARGISIELASKLGLFTKTEESGNWLAIPYIERDRVINHKYRLTREKRHHMDQGAPLTLWNHDCLAWETEQPVIITEGEWDAMAAMTAGFPRCVSVPNGAPQTITEDPFEAKRYEFLWRSRELLDRVKRFIIATDGDEPGRILAADLVRLLGIERCSLASYPDGCKDLNEVLLALGPAGVTAVINEAKPYPVKGLYRFSDFPLPPATEAVKIDIDGIREHFPLTLGSFSVITGYSGIGKTSLMCFILADLLKQGVRMAVGSFETLPHVLEAKMKAALLGVAYENRMCHQPNRFDDLLEDRFGVISQNCADEESEMDLEALIELMKVAALRDNARLFVIDPWNEIEHKRRGDETEHEYTGRAIRAIKRFCRQYNVAVWLVAHPKKPDGESRTPGLYDISGSAHFANKADYGVTIHRADKTSTEVDFIVSKVRMGLPGKVGVVALDYLPDTSSYEQTPESRQAA